MTTNLVVFASEQLWPNLHSVVHWHGSGSHISKVFILHTEDLMRSIHPAQSLEKFCKSRKIESRLQSTAMDPAMVVKHIEGWQRENPQEDWVINATGGTKLMTAGFLEFIGKPRTSVIYREIDGKWFEISRADSLAIEELKISRNEMDKVLIEDLISMTWEHGDWKVKQGTPVSDLAHDIPKITESFVNSGDWVKTFNDLGMSEPQMKSGFLFERYLSAVLHQLGVTNARCNVSREAAGQGVQEIDLIANHQGKIRILDCKLRTKNEEDLGKVEPIATQIRQAQQTSLSIGGLSAEILLVRPNREFTDTEKKLAGSCKVRVLDQNDAGEMLSKIANFFDIHELPPSLKEADKILQKAHEPGCYSPFRMASPQVAPLVSSLKEGVFNLEAAMTELGKQTSSDLVAFDFRGHLFLRISGETLTPLGKNRSDIEKALRNRLRFYKIKQISVSNSGQTAVVEVTLLPGVAPSEILARLRGEPVTPR